MSKRSWNEANNLPSPHSLPGGFNQTITSPAQSHHSHHSSIHAPSPKKLRASFEETKPVAPRPAPVRTASIVTATNNAADSRLPGISRKVKACAACRKQKIKCIMTGDPPCQRCKERGLSCKLNKSLQTLMSEDSRWKASVTRDITAVYGSLERVLQLLNLPELPALHLSTTDPAMFFETEDTAGADEDDEEPSDNHSPKVTPVTDHLSHVPIESLYQITGMKSLRASENVDEDQVKICKQLRDTDFVSRGIVKIEDAEYLATFYLNKLDPYIWHLASDYTDLESFRSRSPTLTACILTVAALHDTTRSHLYTVCGKEYRRLVSNAMFERKIDIEYLRALVIGSYWLSDISWTLSGYAIRRASEFQFKQCYQMIADSVKNATKDIDQKKLDEAMVGLRIIYHLYICDHHLSVLYGRSSIMRDNESYIIGWENYLSSPLAAAADRRIAGQICLMYLMNQIREKLGPEDTTVPLPESAIEHIIQYEANLDDWIARFSRHNAHDLIGQWPNQGAIMHYHWAKLYLTSYSLRGLPEHSAVIPEHFLEFASAAVGAATNIINLLLEDKDAHMALAYVPHHVHGMIAFATMFLLKVATRHAEQLFIDKNHLGMLMGALSRQFRLTVVGKDHLIHRMAEGVEKMADMLTSKSRNRTPHNGLADTKSSKKNDSNTDQVDQDDRTYSEDRLVQALANGPVNPSAGVNVNSNGVFDGSGVMMHNFDFNDPSLGLGMPFFDFEGTTLNPADGSMWTFDT
ncbi:hypothetical protein LTR64_001772 [Lithohypha guttulata]|uniref:uncharacterized protein n=1 Tax=Lithohypha guttulata TaxID=1690604 RepID=UPI002DE073C6|nr:hypothetical protein LTR51_003966 [Lithohypha guttulata]